MSRPSNRFGRRFALAAALGLILATLSVPVGIEIAARMRPSVDLSKLAMTSPLLLDADGRWLDAALSADDKWRFAATVADAPPLYLDLLLAYEDHRFGAHSGVSYRAVVRAAVASLRAGRIVSGASTLPMQVARLLEGQAPGAKGKIAQAVAARRLVLDHTDDEILDFYLTLAPFGGNLEGLEAAAMHYFGKRARDLDAAEAAVLVAIPQAPEARRLDGRRPEAAIEARARVLDRAAAIGVISAANAEDLSRMPVKVRAGRAFGTSRPVLAGLRNGDPAATTFATTLDAKLQALVLQDLQAALEGKPETVNGAAMIIRNHDGAVLAQVGNARGLDSPAGYLDLTARSRSPGSALKPFIYAMAFDAGHVHPRTMFHDRAQRYGGFSPRNFGEAEPGPVDLRTALATSLNTAAVAVLNEVGPRNFIAKLRSAGVRIDLPEEAREGPGLAVSLGGVGISLSDLAALYVALANGGQTRPLHTTPRPERADARVQLFGPGAVWAVTDALAGARPPDHGLPLKAGNGALRVAYKTGTSSGRRDTWAVGYDRLHTVAVWIGRTDTGGMPEASGRTTAAPLLWSIFRALPRPADGVIPDLPAADAHLGWDDPPLRLRVLGGDSEIAPLAIQFPQRGGNVRRAPGSRQITLSLSGGTPPYSWIVNDQLQPASLAQDLTLEVETGPLTITVLDGKGQRDSLATWVE